MNKEVLIHQSVEEFLRDSSIDMNCNIEQIIEKENEWKKRNAI